MASSKREAASDDPSDMLAPLRQHFRVKLVASPVHLSQACIGVCLTRIEVMEIASLDCSVRSNFIKDGRCNGDLFCVELLDRSAFTQTEVMETASLGSSDRNKWFDGCSAGFTNCVCMARW